MKYRVYNGRKILLWQDKWLEDSPLIVNALKEISLEDYVKPIAAYWDHHSGWKWDTLICTLPPLTLRMAETTIIRTDDIGTDGRCWGLSENGKFSVKSAYNSLHTAENLPTTWNTIWKLHVPQKISTFMWTLCHGKIMTIGERSKRRMTNSPFCQCCPGEPERLDHLFRSCSRVKHIWRAIPKRGSPSG